MEGKGKAGEGRWRGVFGKGGAEVAEMIRRDRIDILVELSGHTAGNRMDVVVRKPSPIQVTMIGYPNTTGTTHRFIIFSFFYLSLHMEHCINENDYLI